MISLTGRQNCTSFFSSPRLLVFFLSLLRSSECKYREKKRGKKNFSAKFSTLKKYFQRQDKWTFRLDTCDGSRYFLAKKRQSYSQFFFLPLPQLTRYVMVIFVYFLFPLLFSSSLVLTTLCSGLFFCFLYSPIVFIFFSIALSPYMHDEYISFYCDIYHPLVTMSSYLKYVFSSLHIIKANNLIILCIQIFRHR